MNFAETPILNRVLDFFLADRKTNTLNIELVPYTMHYKNVRAVVPGEVWHVVCDITHQMHNRRCCKCRRSAVEARLECHEVWSFTTSPAPVMKMTGMLSLCHLCHMGKHIKFAELNGELPATRTHLMKYHQLTPLQFWWKVQKAVAKVRQLSRYEYSLDLTYLNDPRYKKVVTLMGRQFSTRENKNCKGKSL
jgi:hypothetical protein